MKMVKSLLLGTAAGLLAVAGAQAADMPVKAKPVEYVKVCSLYGAGFYYIPGTDTCLKVGGYVRVQTEWGAGSSGQAYGAGGALAQAKFNRQDTNDINWTTRAVVTLDARTQTDYGTLRSYIRAGWNQSTPGLVGAGTTPCNNGAANNCLAYWDRAFIQFAGFTVGRGQSFFDLFTYGGAYTYLNVRTAGDTGAAGVDLWAYTVQFGNGVSYTLSLEDPAGHSKFGTCDGAAGCWGINGAIASDNGLVLQGGNNNGFRVPDIVSNLRIDQAWGYLGLSTVIHDVSGAYYGAGNNVNNGHPPDKYGWAFAVGGLLNLAGGDIVGVNFVYANGAPGYATNAGAWQIYNNSQSVGVGWTQDGIFDSNNVLFGNTDIELTKAWSINAAYQHIWGPAGTWGGKWRTTVYGGYVAISYSDKAKAIINTHLPTPAGGGLACGVPVAGSVWPPINLQNGQNNSCSPDYSFYQIGSRTQFNPAPLMDIGLDVVYTRLNTAYKGASFNIYPANAPRPAVSVIDDQSVLSAIVRWQRNFYP